MSKGIRIKQQNFLVTGANRGIGKSIVEELLNEGAAKVYAAVRDVDSVKPLLEKHGDCIVPLELDLTKPSTITAAAAAASDVAVVINNAGVLRQSTPLDADAIDSLQLELEVNLFGLIRMAQAFAPVLKENGNGAFVQLNSVASLKTFAGFTTYCASKAASYAVTQGMRDILKPEGIAVLSVHPGPIGTDMADQAGLREMSEPPEVVAKGIVQALQSGEFLLFPDSMAKQIYAEYQSFAKNVVEADLMEG